jgi:nucleolar protein 56
MCSIRDFVRSKIFLHTTWYASFLVEIDEKGQTIMERKLSGKDPVAISEDLLKMERGEVLPREKELASISIPDGTTDPRTQYLSVSKELLQPRSVRVPSPEELGFDMLLLSEATSLKALAFSGEGPDDSNILSAVGALTDIDSSLNLITERMREWYSKYWQGASSILDDPEILKLISEDPDPFTVHSRLDNMEIEGPEKEASDLSGMSALAELAISLWSARERTENYLESEMICTAPCLAEVAGPLVGARLIHSAGGLVRLARLPSSTVQVLGAEKMFFKFLKEGGKPPKHGVLFQHPWVHSLPPDKRGKMARSIASAASLAASMDAYGGGDPAPLKKRIETRRKEILEMESKRSPGGGRQPPFREGWWADKPLPRKGKGPRGKPRRKRK